MTTVHLDFETRSEADLKSCGAARYAADPTTEVLCACYKIGSGPVKSWRRGSPPPEDLISEVKSGATVCAHNAMFELCVWTYLCGPRMCWGPISPDQMDCTMSRAYALSLPGSLEQVCKLLRVTAQKDMAGHALMMKMCKPLPRRRGETDTAVRWYDAPDALDRLIAYCVKDVEAEYALDTVLPQLSPVERDVYHFDLRTNLRGFRLDTALMRKANDFVNEAAKRVNDEISHLTGGLVPKSTQLPKLKAWLSSRGVEVKSLGKGAVEEVFDDVRAKGDEVAERVIELRRIGAKATSLAKFGSGLNCANAADQRARGLLVYHKAGTGRWAGSLYQPHNLERIDPERDGPVVERMLGVLRDSPTASTAVDWAELLGYEPMRVIGKCARAMIVAGPGKELIGADYSNVEGRGSAWLAGETWKIDAFRAYDAGTGPDLYKLGYSRSFGKPVELVTKPERQIGKVQELALNYQGSVGAYRTMGANYSVHPADVLAAVAPVASVDGWNAAKMKYESSNTHGLDIDEWTALKYVVDSWRAGHSRIVKCWWDFQDAAIEAVSDPGRMISLLGGRIRFYCAKNQSFLYMYMPSGRPLAYFRPRIQTAKATGKRQVVFEGRDSRTNVWGDIALYGGLEWENAVQGMCRDILAYGLMQCENAGYPPVLHVHDEGVYEVDEGAGSEEDIRRYMCELQPWAAGFPLSSASWRDRRYVK